MRLIAELTMPNIGSWNGKWSVEGNKYTKVFSRSASKVMTEYIGSYIYNFRDGWTAKVEIRKAEPKEKVTNKFAGYDWMLSSIKINKAIII